MMLPEKRLRLLDLFRERGFAYVHVPKTAGYAVTQLLCDGVASEHATALVLRSQLGVATWDTLFTFGFVRDPGSRFLSSFWFLKGGGLNTRDAEWSEQNLSRFASAESVMQAAPDRLSVVLSRIHFRRQVEFLCDQNGERLVNFVGTYERFDRDFTYALTTMGLAPRDLPIVNQTRYMPERLEDWDQASLRRLGEFYREDYLEFDYRVPGKS